MMRHPAGMVAFRGTFARASRGRPCPARRLRRQLHRRDAYARILPRAGILRRQFHCRGGAARI